MKSTEISLWKVTVGFGLIGALIGLFLRYFLAFPLPFDFKYVLHAHSHVMLLGWLLNAFILLIYYQWNKEMPKNQRLLFWVMSLCVLGMLFSFPFQGYAPVSISFSTLHIFLSYILLVKIWRLCKGRGTAGKLVKAGIVCFFFSSIGPFALGVLMANGMRGTVWYDQAIFFYLHFLYNGAFLLLMLAFIVSKWTKVVVVWRERAFLFLMIAGVTLSWFHNLDYAFDAVWINFLGGIGAVFQLIGGILLLGVMDWKRVGRAGVWMLSMLGMKWIFGIIGSFPLFADLVVENRVWLIAYLHFIFLGIYTPFVWIALNRYSSRGLIVYFLFFLLTEFSLIAPSLNLYPDIALLWPKITLVLYAVFVGVWGYLVLDFIRMKRKVLRPNP